MGAEVAESVLELDDELEFDARASSVEQLEIERKQLCV